MVSIPFIVVYFWEDKESEFQEISLEYLSNCNVRVKREDGSIDLIPLEDYVVGVVGGEMPVSFEVEALKAQSVASRTYVIHKLIHNKNNDYDVVDTVSNQVFLDENELKTKWGDNYEEYINKVRQVVEQTAFEYLEYDGEVIDALFFSTSNGYTEDAEVVFSNSVPYLKSVESDWDEEVASAFYTTTNISLQEFYDKLNLSYDKELNVEILERSVSNRRSTVRTKHI